MEITKSARGTRVFSANVNDAETQELLKRCAETEIAVIKVHLCATPDGFIAIPDLSAVGKSKEPDKYKAMLPIIAAESLITTIAVGYGVPPSHLARDMMMKLLRDELAEEAGKAGGKENGKS